jgi:hypothetical protein
LEWASTATASVERDSALVARAADAEKRCEELEAERAVLEVENRVALELLQQAAVAKAGVQAAVGSSTPYDEAAGLVERLLAATTRQFAQRGLSFPLSRVSGCSYRVEGSGAHGAAWETSSTIRLLAIENKLFVRTANGPVDFLDYLSSAFPDKTKLTSSV